MKTAFQIPLCSLCYHWDDPLVSMGYRCLLLPSSFFLMFNCPRGLPRWLSGRATGDAGLSLGQEDLLEKGMVTHPSILAWRIIAWTEELGGLKSMGSQRVRHMTE